MREMSVTDFSRNLRTVFDRIEHGREEVVLIRNKHPIARIIPGSPYMTASEAMSGLYRTLSEDAGKRWLSDSRLNKKLESEMRNVWDS